MIQVFDDEDDLALAINGKKRKLQLQHFSDLAAKLGLNARQINTTYKQFSSYKQHAFDWLDRSFLSEQNREGYKEKMNRRYKRLGL